MSIVEQRPCGGAELVAAFGIQALIELTGRNFGDDNLPLAVRTFPRGLVRLELGNLIAFALQAADALRPSGGFQVGLTLLFSAERLLNFYQAFADSVILSSHDSLCAKSKTLSSA